MHDVPRDLMRPDLWAGSLERSLERRRRSRRGSVELGRLRGARELSDPDVLLDSLVHSQARREAVERASGLPAPAARGLSIVGLIAAVAAPATGAMATVASAATPTTGQSDTPPPPTGKAGAGSTGHDSAATTRLAVEGLQTALGLPADGNFGAQTVRAVKAFQKAHRLHADGVVGRLTRRALGLPAGATLKPSAATTAAASAATTPAPTTTPGGTASAAAAEPGSARTARTTTAAVAVTSSAGGAAAGTLAPSTLSTLVATVPASIKAKAAPARATAAPTPPTPTAKLAPAAMLAPAAKLAPVAKLVPAAQAISTAAAVRSLQRRLGVTADGHFGAHTRSALRRFQAAHKLTVDGVVGPATLTALGLRGAVGTSLANLLAKVTAPPARALAPATALPTAAVVLTAAVISPGSTPPPTAIAAGATTGGAAPTAPPSVAAATNPQAPAIIAAMEAAGDRIATLPYIWGGGHASFAAAGYDCSGSVSYVLHAAGLLSAPDDSTGLESYGAAGPGADVTIYANSTHTFIVIDGRRFDTIALQQTGTRWSSTIGSTAGYVVRHPVGL